MQVNCKHNNRTRFKTGFYCNDCKTYFDEDSEIYKLSEGLSNLWLSDVYRFTNLYSEVINE